MLSQSFRAWLAAAITAIQISLAPVGASASDLVNFVSDPFDLVYTHSEADVADYFDKSVIQIVPDGSIIDGVLYDDIWLSHDASDIFRTNAFDFQSAFSIASNSNGTFASGSGYLGEFPVFNFGSSSSPIFQIQPITFPKQVGSYSFGSGRTLTISNVSSNNYVYFSVDGSSTSQVLVSSDYLTAGFRSNSSVSSDGGLLFGQYVSSSSPPGSYVISPGIGFSSTSSLPWNRTSFSFDYVSGSIPSDPLPDDQGIVLHVPSAHPDNTLHQFLVDNPDYAQPGGKSIDISVPDFNIDLDDLADILIPLIPVINADFSTEINPVAPVPGEGTISQTQYSVLDSILQRIKLSIDSLAPLISSIPSAISSAAQDVITAIQSIPSAISSLGDRLLQDIEQGPIRVFDKVLDVFRSIFAPVINLITAGLGIWHYVVDWLSTISVPFTFILSVLPSGVMVPIYAAVAGSLVIAIWRRFGK